nr:senescence-associated carboxylesterase 101 [Quercus suber]
MAFFEWYKKFFKQKGIGFYDSYKNGCSTNDINVILFKKILTNYWEEMVDEAEKKPQKEGASFRTQWLFAGTNYRWMIEPQDIVEHYKGSTQDYRLSRSHYEKLEQWLKETEKPSSGLNDLKKQNVASSLTDDSLFWAHVEEARISVARISHKGESDMEKESLNCRLIEFENYVLDLIKNYAVSPEIFFTGSSFMKWWEEYRKIKGTSYSLRLANLMNNAENYDKYATGCLVIH